MTAPARSTHFGFLDSIRGLAAFYVVLHHASQSIAMDSRSVWKFVHTLFGGGHYAVDVFIVLSGFSLGIPVWTGKYDGFSKYICRRAVRILPPYFITCAICLALIYTVIDGGSGSRWENSAHITTMGLITHLFMVYDWSTATATQINYVLWSVAVEWKIYFLLPLIVYVITQIGGAMSMLVIGVLSYGAWIVIYKLGVLNPGAFGSSLYYVWLFAMGLLSSRIAIEKSGQVSCADRKKSNYFLVATALAAVVACVITRRTLTLQTALQIQSGFVGAWAAVLLYWFAIRPRQPIRPSALATVTGSLGTMGYSIYLIHPPIVQLIYQWIFERNGWTGSAAIVPMTVLCALIVPLAAYGFHICFERPFHHLSRSLFTASRKPAIMLDRSIAHDASQT